MRRFFELVLGPPAPARLPERVIQQIAREQDRSEILVTVVQIAAIATFAVLYALTPKAFPPSVPFEPVPIALAVYGLFTLVRLGLALRGRLSRGFLALSVVIDISVLMLTIWSFHLQYQAPPAMYLKAPTLMYVFILIALRALRFQPGYVLLTGAAAALGWLVLVAYAVLDDQGVSMTRNFAVYMASYSILLGAEFDKIVSISMVTGIVALALFRARKLLLRAVQEQTAAAELSRFFAPEVADRIRASAMAFRPGEAERRQAAILFLDLRGFTELAQTLPPAAVMRLLAEYQARTAPAIHRHGGSIDKYLGDGLLASFGATSPSATYAADAVRAVDDILEEAGRWQTEMASAGLSMLQVGAALATGEVMFGTVGDASRLEYTVIGDPVNLAAKLEKHTKAERVRALCPADAFALALAQGLEARPRDRRARRFVEGMPQPVDLVVLG